MVYRYINVINKEKMISDLDLKIGGWVFSLKTVQLNAEITKIIIS